MLKAVEMAQSNGGCRDPDSRAVYEGRLFEPQYRYVVLSTCVIALPSSCRFAADHLDWQRQRLSLSHELEFKWSISTFMRQHKIVASRRPSICSSTFKRGAVFGAC